MSNNRGGKEKGEESATEKQHPQKKTLHVANLLPCEHATSKIHCAVSMITQTLVLT